MADRFFKYSLTFISSLVILLFISMFCTLIYQSLPSLKEFGFGFYTKDVWNPTTHTYGGLSFLVGTLITSFLALAISLPFSLAIAIFLGECYREGAVSTFLKSMVELLAGIPSIIYGLWGLFVFVPAFRALQLFLYKADILHVAPIGFGMFTSAIILAIMIIPYAASIGREVISMMPNDLKEAGLSMGGTRYEVIKNVILPYCRSGIFAGVLLSLGRALGETMAVTMVIGNRNLMPKGIFDPASTLASVLANEFSEATNAIHLSSLVHLGLLLFLTTAVINMIGKVIIKRVTA